MAACQDVIVIDGGMLEGGGQILRNSAALSCLLRKPITVHNIRAGRSNPGLRPQHLMGLQLIRDLCNGKLTGDRVGSTEITFHPGPIKAGSYSADTKTAGSICLLLQLCLPCVIYGENSINVRFGGGTDTNMAPPIDHYTMVCQQSICLLMQASMPCLMYGGAESCLSLRGGTNAEMAPQIDYTTMVFRPIAERFGMKFDCDIQKRGYFPKGGGVVQILSYPTKKLNAVTMTTRGQVTKISIRSFVAGALPIKVAEGMAQSAVFKLKKKLGEVPISKDVLKEPEGVAVGTGTGIIIVAETSNGCLLAGSGLGKRGVPAEKVGADAAESLLANLNHGGCVDEHLQDQLILLMALAEGKSELLCGPITLHTQTAIHIAKLLTQAQFDVKQISDSTNIIECLGVGLVNNQI